MSRTREGQEEGKATQRDDDGKEDGGSHDNVNDMTEGEIYEAREGYGRSEGFRQCRKVPSSPSSIPRC